MSLAQALRRQGLMLQLAETLTSMAVAAAMATETQGRRRAEQVRRRQAFDGRRPRRRPTHFNRNSARPASGVLLRRRGRRGHRLQRPPIGLRRPLLRPRRRLRQVLAAAHACRRSGVGCRPERGRRGRRCGKCARLAAASSLRLRQRLRRLSKAPPGWRGRRRRQCGPALATASGSTSASRTTRRLQLRLLLVPPLHRLMLQLLRMLLLP
mmetsp:Transcript_83582/g.232806  ORF Transcript_83582/g.232806 Transcript_83582/m.232806 type:complete len:210 (+) Transcript_83582:143-772(+)